MTDIRQLQSENLGEHFKGLDWSGREVSAIEFEDCVFSDCDFSEAQFKKCKFLDCRFVNCNLSVAKVTLSRFSNVEFESCKLIGVDWTTAAWPKYATPAQLKFIKCTLNDSSFFGLNLQELVIEECKAHDVDFREGVFSDANFGYTDFTNSMFRRTNLSGANFAEATEYSIDIYINDIKRAKFTRFEAVRLLEALEIELVD
ncbi:MAG: pentapeptide repeat-containing protein [Gammaproteobacteria bacterium]|nr:pentapeptide repeat-containing protein [Gammaproteobacteria bacterium]